MKSWLRGGIHPLRTSRSAVGLLRLGVLLALSGTSDLAGQMHPPWQGRGVPPAAARPSAAAIEAIAAQAVAMIGLTVSDMDSSVAFYTTVLGFTKETDDQLDRAAYGKLLDVSGARIRVVRLRLGEEYLQLTEFVAPKGRPAPPDARSNDRAFQHVAIIVSDMDQAYARLRQFRVRHVSPGPQTLPATIPAAAGIRAFYFRDPDAHALEILQFPPGKGDPKWRRPGGPLFLGIDHTAIVVSDTRASLAFYRDLLGFRVAGESVNFGKEQESLNDVRGARLRITGLRAPSGPGIEFLEYLAPRNGRPFPSDERANDLGHWQTTVRVRNARAAATTLRDRRFKLVSSDALALPDTALGFREGVRVRDPDGHVIQLVNQ